MATKNNPGKFDCYDKAEPDEPMFVLLARDARAPLLVELWANIENGNVHDAVRTFNELVQEGLYGPSDDLPEKTQAKVGEATKCAGDMRAWFDEHRA